MLRDTLGRRTSDNTEPFLVMSTLGRNEQEPEELANPQQEPHTNDLNDDIFGSAPNSPTLNNEGEGGRSNDHSDIPRLRSLHITNGYREGIALSKESHIQAGFDEGFSLGGEIGQRAGWILGVLDGMARGVKSKKKDEDHEIGECFAKAQEELKIEKLLGEEHFGVDGIWLYEVPGEDGEDVTFEVVANAHPILRKWDGRVRDLGKRLGVLLDEASGLVQ